MSDLQNRSIVTLSRSSLSGVLFLVIAVNCGTESGPAADVDESTTASDGSELYGRCLEFECAPDAYCLTDSLNAPTVSLCAPRCPDEDASMCPTSSFGGDLRCYYQVMHMGEQFLVCSPSCADVPCPDGMLCENNACTWPSG